MSSAPLSEDARALIRAHVPSVGRLDLLLVLYGDPRMAWTAARMAKQMRASVRWAASQLQALEAAKVLAADADGDERSWRYAPAEARTADAVESLVSACRMDWPAVTREVMQTRPSGAEAFSDAFRLRRRDG